MKTGTIPALKKDFKYFTLPAFFYFLLPGLLWFAVAQGPIDKPAEPPQSKLVGRAESSLLTGTILFGPAWFLVPGGSPPLIDQKEYLPFN